MAGCSVCRPLLAIGSQIVKLITYLSWCNVDTNNILAQRWIDKLVFTCTDLIAVEPQWRWVGCVPRPLTSSIKRFRQYRPGDARPSLVWVFGIWGPYTVVAPHQAYQGPSNTALSISEGIVVISKWSVPKSQKGCDHITPSLAMLGSWSHCRHHSLRTNSITICALMILNQGPLSTCWLFQVRWGPCLYIVLMALFWPFASLAFIRNM